MIQSFMNVMRWSRNYIISRGDEITTGIYVLITSHRSSHLMSSGLVDTGFSIAARHRI